MTAGRSAELRLALAAMIDVADEEGIRWMAGRLTGSEGLGAALSGLADVLDEISMLLLATAEWRGVGALLDEAAHRTRFVANSTGLSFMAPPHPRQRRAGGSDEVGESRLA